jgi:transcriptional regulator with XRE-family HTH domain
MATEEDVAVGRRLAEARHGAGLSQAEVGRRLGIPQSRIAKLEIGTRRLLWSEGVELAGLYDVQLQAFLIDIVAEDHDDGSPQTEP